MCLFSSQAEVLALGQAAANAPKGVSGTFSEEECLPVCVCLSLFMGPSELCNIHDQGCLIHLVAGLILLCAARLSPPNRWNWTDLQDDETQQQTRFMPQSMRKVRCCSSHHAFLKHCQILSAPLFPVLHALSHLTNEVLFAFL